MRRYHRIGIVVLCAVLSLCAACSPAAEVTPAPTPEPTPAPTSLPTPEATSEPTLGPTAEPTSAPTPAPTRTPAGKPTPTPAPWEAAPGQFILDNLNAAFSDGRLCVRVFFNNGSGPANAVMLDSECGREVRELFSSYDWKAARPPQVESVPFDSFSVELYDDNAPYYVWFSAYSNVLCLSPAGGAMDRLYFSADGAERLCGDLTALCPDPIIQCALVSSAAQKTETDTARQFMDDLFAVMLKNGHIADHEVFGLDVIEPADALTFNVRFRMKAAHSEQSLWTSGSGPYPADESGWTDTIKWMVCLSADPEQGIYRLDWIG